MRKISTKVSLKEGDRFDHITVISRAENFRAKCGKSVHMWNCLCFCGKEKVIPGPDLIRGRTKHCGCQKRNRAAAKTKIEIGYKFNRLTMVSFFNGIWKCQCDCGKIIDLPTRRITSENTKSCGCLMLESRKKKALLMQEKRTKYSASTASARRVWKQYCYRDKKCDITFEQWMEISQKNCSYCGIKPSTKYNYFAVDSSRPSKKKALEGEFCYNGMDRIDSSKHHTIDNVVPCCALCNRNKSNLSVDKFLERVNGLRAVSFTPLDIQELQISSTYLKASVKPIYIIYSQDSDLNLEEFYWLSQQPCYYCGCKSSNFCNKYLKDKRMSQKAKDNSNFHYNGLDRADIATLEKAICPWKNGIIGFVG